MTRQQAVDAGLARYAGSICRKHPEKLGARYVANWRCVECALQATTRYLRSAHGDRARLSYEGSPRGRAMRARQKAKYRSSPKGKATEAAYRRGEVTKAYEASHKNIRAAFQRSYRQLPKEKARRAIFKREREQHVSRNATPIWADKRKIAAIYELASERTRATGVLHVVDHIVPLKGREVCGLHVETNLRVLPWRENVVKGNRLIG